MRTCALSCIFLLQNPTRCIRLLSADRNSSFNAAPHLALLYGQGHTSKHKSSSGSRTTDQHMLQQRMFVAEAGIRICTESRRDLECIRTRSHSSPSTTVIGSKALSLIGVAARAALTHHRPSCRCPSSRPTSCHHRPSWLLPSSSFPLPPSSSSPPLPFPSSPLPFSSGCRS